MASCSISSYELRNYELCAIRSNREGMALCQLVRCGLCSIRSWEGGIASVPASLSEGGMASAPVTLREGGVASRYSIQQNKKV